MKDWGEFELEKKGADLRLSARGWPALLIAIALVGGLAYQLLV